MNCPHCGGNTPIAQPRCLTCGRSISVRADVAAAVLTPPPAPGLGQMPTIDPELIFTGVGQTRVPSAGHDPDVTAFTPLPADVDVTGFNTPLPPIQDDMTCAPDAAHPLATAGPLAIGQRFGPRYRIVKLLG